MPTYEYYCETCTNQFEIVCPMSVHVTRTRCPKCNAEAWQTFTRVSVHDDHPLWLNDEVRNQIQGDNEAPVETRSQYKRYMAEKGYVEVDRRV